MQKKVVKEEQKNKKGINLNPTVSIVALNKNELIKSKDRDCLICYKAT
jgi:hypothetical protein